MKYLLLSLAVALTALSMSEVSFAQHKGGGSSHHAPSHHPSGGTAHHQPAHHTVSSVQHKQTIVTHKQAPAKIVTAHKPSNLYVSPNHGGLKVAGGTTVVHKNGSGVVTAHHSSVANHSGNVHLPKGVAAVHTTHHNIGHVGYGHGGYKTYHYNGHWYRAPWVGWGYNNWSRWCWYPRYGCYCYWSPVYNDWFYWYSPWSCYLPVDCLVVMAPQPVVQSQTYIFPPATGPAAGTGPDGVPAYDIGPGGIPGAPADPGLPPIPNGELPVAPGAGNLVPTK